MNGSMETFAEVRQHILSSHKLTTDEPFLLSFEFQAENDRRQSIFLAELESADGRRYLRIETTVAPLEDFDAEKCLRINLLQRVGYLAVGDLDGTPYIKMCENIPYSTLSGQELDHSISRIAPLADRMEEALESDWDIS